MNAKELGRMPVTAGGGTWNRKSRPRIDDHPTQRKLRWELTTPTNQEQADE